MGTKVTVRKVYEDEDREEEAEAAAHDTSLCLESRIRHADAPADRKGFLQLKVKSGKGLLSRSSYQLFYVALRLRDQTLTFYRNKDDVSPFIIPLSCFVFIGGDLSNVR